MEQTTKSVFRYFRPLEFDKKTFTMIPKKNGGIAFYAISDPKLVDTDFGYEFWINRVPENVEFSQRQAIKDLRLASKEAAPYGYFKFNKEEPILDTMVSLVIKEKQWAQSSDAAIHALMIMMNNLSESTKMAKAVAKVSSEVAEFYSKK